MRTPIWLVAVALVGFGAGRLLGTRAPAAGEPASVAPTAIASTPRGTTELAHRIAAVAPGASARDDDDRALAEVAVEARDGSDLRHAEQRAAIREKVPELPAAETDRVIAIQDAVFQANRTSRADFVLGTISESDYTAALADHQRTAFRALREALTAAQFTTLFAWSPDADPYDPEGAVPSPDSAPLPPVARKDDTRWPE